MTVAATLYYRGLRAFGITALQRRMRDAGLILCYHNVVRSERQENGSLGLHLPRARFERQMRWLAEHYEVIRLSEFADRLTTGACLRTTAAVTFDDGYSGVFENAVPVLRRLGLPATVFIVPGAVDQAKGFWWDERASHRSASWTAIRAALGQGIELGAHSLTHPSLPTLDDRELRCEIIESRVLIHHATGVAPEFFAYPFGHWNGRVRSLVQSAGYKGAVTVDCGLNNPGADLWALRRINIPSGITDAAFEAWAGGLQGLRRAG
jgi:peptidoglycan/xylan/chitin deacetylase (PgdA/CDA1 family)